MVLAAGDPPRLAQPTSALPTMTGVVLKRSRKIIANPPDDGATGLKILCRLSTLWPWLVGDRAAFH